MTEEEKVLDAIKALNEEVKSYKALIYQRLADNPDYPYGDTLILNANKILECFSRVEGQAAYAVTHLKTFRETLKGQFDHDNPVDPGDGGGELRNDSASVGVAKRLLPKAGEEGDV